MKWKVTGAWKADGTDAELLVEAPNQRAAEAIGAQRGIMVESALPESAAMVAAIPTQQQSPAESDAEWKRRRTLEYSLKIRNQTPSKLKAVGYVGLIVWLIASAIIILGGQPDPILWAIGAIGFLTWIVLLIYRAVAKAV